jgi:TATA-box binding protein (TBP) (component of TFIID and TFIIIB)
MEKMKISAPHDNKLLSIQEKLELEYQLANEMNRLSNKKINNLNISNTSNISNNYDIAQSKSKNKSKSKSNIKSDKMLSNYTTIDSTESIDSSDTFDTFTTLDSNGSNDVINSSDAITFNKNKKSISSPHICSIEDGTFEKLYDSDDTLTKTKMKIKRTLNKNDNLDTDMYSELEPYQDIYTDDSDEEILDTESDSIKINNMEQCEISENIESECATVDINDDEYIRASNFLQEHGISISVITTTATLGHAIYVKNVAKYIKLRPDRIVLVKYGKSTNIKTNRTIIQQKSKKKKSKINFFNQVTMLIKPTNREKGYINLKLFNNGSVQMTGCKNIDECYDVVEKLIKELRKHKRRTVNGQKYVYYFTEYPNDLNMSGLKIRMINSDFKINYKINRGELYKILKKKYGNKPKNDVDKGGIFKWMNYSVKNVYMTNVPLPQYIECKYNPSVHACVNIKHYHQKKKISIFVFHTGAIIITGARNLKQIISSYNFIMTILNKHKKEIVVEQLDSKKIEKDYLEFIALMQQSSINNQSDNQLDNQSNNQSNNRSDIQLNNKNSINTSQYNSSKLIY